MFEQMRFDLWVERVMLDADFNPIEVFWVAVTSGIWPGVVFLILKLCGVITWSWWWVTAPLWGVLALFFVLFAACYLIDLVTD